MSNEQTTEVEPIVQAKPPGTVQFPTLDPKQEDLKFLEQAITELRRSVGL